MDDKIIERCSEAIRKAIYADLDTKQAAIDCIKAMREPTPPMVEALMKKYGLPGKGAFWADIWNEGIDAIVGDK